jgi:hypothetical protein
MFGSSEEMHVEHLQNNALNIVEAACSALAQPFEIILRPQFGTRYYPVPVTAAAAAMMLMIPAIAAFFTGLTHMIPFSTAAPAPRGMFDIGSLAKLYFLLWLLHGWRLWKRMLHMEQEQHSQYEGRGLFFLQFLPRASSFWFTRIVWEPALILLLSIVLEDLFIIQSSLSLYMRFAALALAMKSFVNWFRAWEYLRKLLDTRNAAPAIAKLVENQATEEDLAPIHLASFPKNIDPAVRQAAVVQIARAYSSEQ